MRFNPGELNKRITIQEKTTSYDTANQPIETWKDLKTIWAAVVTTGSKELYVAQKQIAETSIVFKIRYAIDITELDRIVYMGQIYEILGTPNDINGNKIEMLLYCKEAV